MAPRAANPARVTPLDRLRVAAALAVTAVLAAGVAASGTTGGPAVSCRGTAVLDGGWQRLAVPAFPAPAGVRTSGRATAFAVDPRAPFRVVVTDGTSVLASDDGGCTWAAVFVLQGEPSAAVPVSGRTARITSLAVTDRSTAVAVIEDGSGSAVRPRVATGTPGRDGTWQLRDDGLPATGRPGPVSAGAGGSVHLAVEPVAPAPAGGTLPSLPPLPLPTPAAGSPSDPAALYSLPADGGPWRPGLSAAELPGPRVDALAADPSDATVLWLVSAGRLLRSSDAGASATQVDSGLEVVTALAAPAGGLVAFGRRGSGSSVTETRDGGLTWRTGPAPSVRAAAVRPDQPRQVLAATGDDRLVLVALDTGARRDVTPRLAGTPSLTADRGPTPTWEVLSGDLLRFVDPHAGAGPVLVRGLDGPGAPAGAVLRTGVPQLTLPPGRSGSVGLSLSIPPTPTPVDLMLLVDVSRSMTPVIEDLTAGTRAMLATLQAAGVDVQVGLATAGTSPTDGTTDPPVDPTRPGYQQPRTFQLLRPVGPPDTAFFAALDRLRPETVPFSQQAAARQQGQLAALDQLLRGRGIRSQNAGAAPLYDVPPGQVARWRPSDRIRRVLVDATDQGLRDTPRGTPVDAAGRPDPTPVLAGMREQRVLHVGLSNGLDPQAVQDLSRLSRDTGAVAPAGGLDCDGDGRTDLAQGAPLVCTGSTRFTAAVLSAVRALPDVQPLSAVVAKNDLRAQLVGLPRQVDVLRNNVLTASLAVTCPAGGPAGERDVAVRTMLRGDQLARGTVRVRCLPAAAVPPAPGRQPPEAPPLAGPAPGLPTLVVVPAQPAPPPAPAQGQPVVNGQVLQVPVGVTQEQEQVEVALAEQEVAPTEGLAPRSARRDEQGALGVLALGMVGASGAAVALGRRTQAVAATG